MIQEIFLLKMGEIVLKGLNRKNFEAALVKNLKLSLKNMGEFDIFAAQSTVTLIPKDNCDIDQVEDKISKVFGIAAYSRSAAAKKDINEICKTTLDYLKEKLARVKTFKVEAKRSDKSFPFKSPKICEIVGAHMLENIPNLRVDVHNPDITITIEVRDRAYIHTQSKKSVGGIPVGTGGKAVILMSGGIDSPVAAYMMAKRGLRLTAVHFASPPYTSARAEDKVATLLSKLKPYCGNIDFIVVPFTKIQETIKNNCPEELFTIIMRRMMMRIAEKIAKDRSCQAIVTGESLGQVASQTLSALLCTDAVSNLPVLRPLIAMDKDEIVTIARKIDTFNTSILPYEDCCTIFTPKHPRTRPVKKFVEFAENKYDFEPLINDALDGLKISW